MNKEIKSAVIIGDNFKCIGNVDVIVNDTEADKIFVYEEYTRPFEPLIWFAVYLTTNNLLVAEFDIDVDIPTGGWRRKTVHEVYTPELFIQKYQANCNSLDAKRNIYYKKRGEKMPTVEELRSVIETRIGRQIKVDV